MGQPVVCGVCRPSRLFNIGGRPSATECGNEAHIGRAWGTCKACNMERPVDYRGYCSEHRISGPNDDQRERFRVPVHKVDGSVEVYRFGYPSPRGVTPHIIPAQPLEPESPPPVAATT